MNPSNNAPSEAENISSKIRGDLEAMFANVAKKHAQAQAQAQSAPQTAAPDRSGDSPAAPKPASTS